MKFITKHLRAWEGPLTSDLVQHPGEFGLGNIPRQLTPDATTTVVCGFCSTGCGLRVHLKDGVAINLSAETDYPVNLGMACPKGWEALTPLHSPDRATSPLLKNPATGRLEPVSWDQALDVFCSRFQSILTEHGRESVAWLGTGQIPCEELAFLGALGKFGMGLIHGDGNTRQCMSTAATAYKESFGFDAPPFTYADFEQSDVLVFIGANPCIAHPIMWQRVMSNSHHPEIIVLDPRTTETAMAATQHLALQPKSDLTLLYGIAYILVSKNWVDLDYIGNHTTNYPAFAEFLQTFDTARVANVTGLTIEAIERCAKTIGQGQRVSLWWTMGVNQSHEATRTAQAIINIALMTGNMGRPGTGANSITGQCNAMGSRLFSNTTNMLGGHDFLNPVHRKKIASILNIEDASIPNKNSLPYDQILAGIESGRIKGLWIVATNTAHSWINQSWARTTLAKLEFLVVQDMYGNTETAKTADLVLPAAGWGEKEGTLINSERRFGLMKKVSRAPGLALSDFNIFRLIAQRWGCGEMFQKWTSPEAAFQIMKELSRDQPCDISGIRDYQMIDDCGGIQWPFAQGSEPLPQVERRLFEDGKYYHSDGRARFIFEPTRPVAEPLDAEFPLVLLTGRGTSAQWHTQTRTGKSDILRKLYPANIYVEVNPSDAERLKIKANTQIFIRSRRGKISATAYITSTVRPGQIFIPMHYPELNQLTFPAFDPYSHQPSYKYCAVTLETVARLGLQRKLAHRN